jgi:hypothetical protein
MFHLVNLPTPRRRLAYRYHVKSDPAERLRALTRRTVDHWLARGRLLSHRELSLLEHLDAAVVSQYAGEVLRKMDDRLPVVASSDDGPSSPRGYQGEPLSHHNMVCLVLAARGTHEAAEGLVEAIDAERILPPPSEVPYHLPWIAALAIATRDPWPEVDRWLAEQLPRLDGLIDGAQDAPQLGATAAGVLLARHGEATSAFRLQPTTERSFSRFAVSGYRFADEAARQSVMTWWDERASRPAIQPAEHQP